MLGVETRSGISPGRPVVTASAAHEAGETADICGFWKVIILPAVAVVLVEYMPTWPLGKVASVAVRLAICVPGAPPEPV